MTTSLSLKEYADRISLVVNGASALKNQWVRAELYDLGVRGGHCYVTLVEKDPASGQLLARIQAIAWHSTWMRLAPRFAQATGRQLSSGMQVMMLLSAQHTAQYGLSTVISDIDPAYTLGAKEQLLRQRYERLQREGILEMNRRLQRAVPLQRIAIISSATAAGYGDFINQLYTNKRNLRFFSRLYPAIMQGDRCPASVIQALDQVYADADTYQWQGVAIIRGGGGTSDLDAFDDYELAANVAQYPLPVIIGIGHERDITLLDYVANARLKTPTAVAEWLIAQEGAVLDSLQSAASAIYLAVTSRLEADRQQLAYIQGQLPAAALQAVSHARTRQMQLASDIHTAVARTLNMQQRLLDSLQQNLVQGPRRCLERATLRLDNIANLLQALSPQATLARGYSITRGRDGKVLRHATDAPAGSLITTILSDGSLTSQVI